MRTAAADRFDSLELNVYPSGGPVVVTDDARGEAGRRVDRFRQRSGVELTVEEVLASPHVFVGSVAGLTEKLLELRERFGISSVMLDDVASTAPIVEALAGR